MSEEAAVAPAPTVRSEPDFTALAKELDLAKAFQEEGIVETPSVQSADTQSQAPAKETQPAPPAADDSHPAFKKSLERVAKEREELRKERDTIKQHQEALKVIAPDKLQVIQRALASNDPMSLLAAFGYSYNDVSNQIIQGKRPEKKPEAPAKEEPRAAQEDPEIAEIKANYRAQRANQQQNQIREAVKSEIVKAADKFPILSKLEDYDGVMGVLGELFNKFGEMPGETAEESILIAAEELEGRRRLEKEKWSKVLTVGSAAVSTVKEPNRDQVQPAPVEAGTKTLTNKAVAPKAPTSNPYNPDKVVTDLASDPNLPW